MSNRKLLPPLFLVALLCACNPAPKAVKLAAPVPAGYKEAPEQFKEGAGWVVAKPGDDKIRPKWWEMYNDPQLNALEEQVAISNQSVKQAEANFREAQALVAIARSSLFPTFGGSASYSRSHYPSNSRAATVVVPGSSAGGSSTSTTTSATSGASTGSSPTSTSTNGSTTTTSSTSGNGTGGTTAYGSGTFNNYSVTSSITYVTDFWHRIRNTIAANTYSAQANAADVATALLTTQSELAQDYFEIRALDTEEGILEDTLKNYKDTLQLTINLFNAGIDSDQDVTLAKTQLDTATAQSTDVGVARASYEHAIATLIGKPAAEFALEPARFVANPPPVPVSVPSELLQRRPDIASAQRLVAQQNALIGVVRAAYYPSIGLSATGGFESANVSNWFTWPSRLWSIGPSVSETLLDFGARRGAVREYQAAYDAAVANYRQTVLSDFQTVEDNLASLRILAQEVEQYETAVRAAARYVELALTRYKTGVDSYLNVITAQNTLLSSRETEVQVQLRQMTASVGLIVALGGGWDEAQLSHSEDQMMRSAPKWTPSGPAISGKQPSVTAPNPPNVAPIPLPGGNGSNTATQNTPQQQK
jgi:NodT family efflux transporter outer membrane factor (OMF) lipoprotein